MKQVNKHLSPITSSPIQFYSAALLRICNNPVISKISSKYYSCTCQEKQVSQGKFCQKQILLFWERDWIWLWIWLWGLMRSKRQCSLLHSATFTPKGWWGPWITVCTPGQWTQGDLLSSRLADRNSQGRGQCMNITPVTYMRTDNARKTWGHSGQLDVYWLPAPVLNYVTENMDLKCVPKSREMSSKKIPCSMFRVRSPLVV